MSAKAIIPVELKFLGTKAGRTCPGSEVTTWGTAHFEQSWHRVGFWFWCLLWSQSWEKYKSRRHKMMTRLWWFSWDSEQDPALPNSICFTLQVSPNLCSPHSWVLECCAPWDISAPPWPLGIPASAPCPAPQPGSHNQMCLFTSTTQQIKVLPAPSALPQRIRVMRPQTLAAAPFFPRGDGALVDALGFSGSLPALLGGLPFNMLHLADWWWHPSPSVLVGLWRQALGGPSSHRLPRASRRAACYSLLIFQ